MRIIAGTHGGRRFKGPPGDRTRPTADRVREGIFSALEARGLSENAIVLDLFAGTGAMAFEAVSRGALSAVCVESDARVARALQKSAEELSLADRVRCASLDLFATARASARLRELMTAPATLVFVDPPYAEIEKIPALLTQLLNERVVAVSATIVIEHATRTQLVLEEPLASVASYRYGDTSVSLVRNLSGPNQ